MSLWGGRFQGKTDPLFRRFNDSLRFDWALAMADIAGSREWAKAIQRAGIITADECGKIVGALDDIGAKIVADRSPAAIVQSGEEDIHSWVESQLIARVGDLGKKLHTGRSRNDQVATDLRLHAGSLSSALMQAIRAVQRSLVELAARESQTVIPGYTHLQRGQPVLFAHWAMAYFEMLQRDMARFGEAQQHAAVCPLGSGALAGTAYPIDREALAKGLGFMGVSRNSMDAVSDRDFVLDVLSACVACALHLSRIAEDLIIYSSAEFAFVTLDDSVTSGSSLMPQKKNPDALELMRGKVGRVLGAYTAMATTLKGLPLAYNKDMQEDKEPLFDACENLGLCLRMLCPVLDTMKVNREACAAAALGDGTSLATDLADYLVEKGVAFRDAHHAAGQLVRVTLESKTPLHKLTLATMKSVNAKIEEDVYRALTVEASLARRSAIGGTSPGRVSEAIAAARGHLAQVEPGNKRG